jgi:uncharacterized hydrophobic protein (TIGR00271 family)
MNEHVDSALFVYVPETEHLCSRLLENPFQATVTPVALAVFLDDPERFLTGTDHVVFSGPLEDFKRILHLATQHQFSVGLVPMAEQKNLVRCYDLPDQPEAVIDLALRRDGQVVDLILCNDEILFFKATIGRLPLFDVSSDVGLIVLIRQAFRKIFGLRLLKFTFKTGEGTKIKTAACGCMIIQHHKHSLASRLIAHDSSLTDGMISLIVSAPFSITEYVKFLFQARRTRENKRHLPSTIGYIKTAQLDIETEQELAVTIDEQQVTRTPLHCTTLPQAIRLNVGEALREKGKQKQAAKETIKTENLPTGKEISKAIKKTIPFFAYASEERFRDLFTALRTDAKTTPAYLVLILLSTMLATLGLYLSSSSVVIGAMLLAPLMAPIVALAMALLRQDTKMARRSTATIVAGVILALFASGLISLLFPYKPITSEMLARLNPTLLDLGVALIAGIAGAYTKSFKEILQSLAGVAIAVALVPPLAVAGIGLGRGDVYFFAQAFLLFSTNLIGITLAATFTFRALGYSAVVGSKRSLAFVAMIMLLISIPLYLSYQRIVYKSVFERSWRQERFLVNDKYLIIQKADVVHYRNREVLTIEILAREPLSRNDLAQLKRKIQTHFSKKLEIRAKVFYIP